MNKLFRGASAFVSLKIFLEKSIIYFHEIALIDVEG